MKSGITICMATYNGYPFLPRQIESILNQMAPTDQLVISDNGSTDESLEYLSSLGDSRIQLLSFPDPKGPVPNFENALKHAKLPVIVLVDQDDVWLPNRLQVVRMAFAGNSDRPLCLVTEGDRIDAEGRVIGKSNLQLLGYRAGLFRNVFKNSYMGCTMAFSQDLLGYVLPIPRSVPMHDSWIGILAEHYGRVEMVLEPSYRYRVHGGNFSHKKNSLFMKISQRFNLIVALAIRFTKFRAGNKVEKL